MGTQRSSLLVHRDSHLRTTHNNTFISPSASGFSPSHTAQQLSITMNDGIQPFQKKQRSAIGSAPDNANKEQLEVESRSLHFDFLPENALDNIVRFRSRSPRALNWSNYTFLEDIHDLYDVAGELGRFLLGRFTGVYVHPDSPKSIVSFFYNAGVANEGTIVCTPAFLLTFIRSGRVMPSFESLFVWNLFPTVVIGNSQLDSLSRQWPNISRLVFLYWSEGNWFESFGKNLESLNVLRVPGIVSEKAHTMKFSTYCPKLRHLYIKNDYWAGIDPAIFWTNVGTHLETICARFNQYAKAHTLYINKYCSNIKRLELTGDNDGNAKCIAFYGEQIEEAKVAFSTESDIKLLSSSCPNARFSLETRSRRDLRIALEILGPQLKALEIRHFYYGVQGDEMPDWSSCRNLESVKFYSYPTIEEMRCMMYKPKSLLRCIELTHRLRVFKKEELEEVISLLSGGTGALEKFEFECGEPLLGAFNKLVERNKALRSVKIIFSDLLPEEKKMDVMETFLKCPSLKKLELDDFSNLDIANPGVQDLRRSLRHRRIYISAFGEILA